MVIFALSYATKLVVVFSNPTQIVEYRISLLPAGRKPWSTRMNSSET